MHDKIFRLTLQLFYSADRAQNLPAPVPENVLRVLQISSKSVHFRRNYSRTCEHQKRAVKSIQYSAEPELRAEK